MININDMIFFYLSLSIYIMELFRLERTFISQLVQPTAQSKPGQIRLQRAMYSQILNIPEDGDFPSSLSNLVQSLLSL